MDPYIYEGTDDHVGIANLEEIIDYAKSNLKVTLLCGNHDESWIWDRMGFERTSYYHYKELHKLYRDNIELFKPCLRVQDVLFTHAGVSDGWIRTMNSIFKYKGSDFVLTQDNVHKYIANEFQKELEHENVFGNFLYPCLESPIFCIGRARGGDAPLGGPFWDDFDYEYWDPDGWDITQIFSHSQREVTGFIGKKENGYCVDSRMIFEYDFETKKFDPANI
jgi:hypothetical protein